VACPLLADTCVIYDLRRGLARGLTAAVLLAVSACKTKEAKLADDLATSASWLAAIDMGGHSWMENRVPVRFARQLVEEGRSELAASGSAIADLHLQSGDAGAARAELARAVLSVDAVLSALDHRDSASVARAMPMIGAQRSMIDSMAKRAKSISQ
jgi:hypothetical protein